MNVPSKTLAMVLTEERKLEAQELSIPEIGHDDAPQRIEACAICGSDYEQFEGVKGFKPIPDFVSDKIVKKQISIRAAIGVTPSGCTSAIRLLESRTTPIQTMHTHDFDLRDAELAIRTLAREIPNEESIHSRLLPDTD